MHFVIAGCINCRQFTYAVMVAQRLKENLPDFTYLKIPMRPEEWDKWLIETCRSNNWYHTKSPLIWREISVKGGKKDFIGDINKFLDLCYDYYGIPQEILSAEQFNRGEMNWFTHRTESEYFENIKSEAKKKRQYRSRQVCITGAASQMTEVIVMELLQIDLQKREDGLEIRLFDQPRKICKLLEKAMDAKQCPGSSGFGNCRVARSMKEAFNNVDLVIVLDFFPRKSKESLVKWLKRNRNAMCVLGKALNEYAPQHCRVIIGSPSTQAICYNATVLASFAKKLHVRNIVAVTQDLGRETLKLLSAKSKVPLKHFYCPPVWGFIGLNKFIDVQRTLQTNIYKVPGKDMNTTLPHGTEEYELRTSECLLSEEGTNELLNLAAQHKSHTFSQLGRWPYLAKVTAILDLLKVWGLKQEDGNGEILCLGVYSDGTFNIPQGIYWSQPVILKNGFWVPFEDFPVPRSPRFNVFYLFLLSVAALYRTKVKPRIYIPPRAVNLQKEKTKFNFDKITEEVGMPAIKTDVECVIYLKYLTKKELGIDLDEVIERIDEETETEELPAEEVARDRIYCECWRQELKELQSIVFARSSTTEVEVDLSDNTSGSEWPIINLPSQISKEMTEERKMSDNSSLSGRMILTKSGNLDSTSSTVCSCEKLSNGSVCQCLGVRSAMGESSEEKISTEHFYKEQNAQVFEEDLKDVIYADTYEAERHVTFDSLAKQEDEKGFHLKFYGKKNAVRDKEADLKNQKRILRYERGGEDSVEEELEGPGEKEGSLAESLDVDATKFQVSVEGTSFDIIGDRCGLDSLEEMRSKSPGKGSSVTFKEMYADEVTASIQFIPPVEKSTESSEQNLSYSGEGQYVFGSTFKSLPEIPGENTMDRASLTSLEEDLGTIWGEQYSLVGMDWEDSEEKSQEEKLAKTKRKREGIPLCCLCRCLVPEGLPCCPCGATTVVEVFKKESVEIFIQSEDHIEYAVEYFEAPLQLEYEKEFEQETDKSSSSAEEEPKLTLIKKNLPPESFLPFSPKPENIFKEAARPLELTKEYADSLKKVEREIPEKCLEVMAEAKMKLEEMELQQGEASVIEEETSDVEKENLPPLCNDIEHIKTDFSDLKLFIPCGLEDWRLTVQKKYREWFFEGPKIKDETYYDVAIEEVSEDEFEVDKELEQFFEK